MKCFVIESPYKDLPNISRSLFGWGNGYVAIPPTHILWGKDYNDANELISIHYGLTFSDIIHESNNEFVKHAPAGWWVFGFDTAHFDDDEQKWPKEAVEAEAKRLLTQFFELETGELF
jgi:hypothetical protein